MSKNVRAKSIKKRSSRKSKAEFMPLAGAGLIRFFREETGGISISPYIVMIMAIMLIIVVLALPALLPL
ncbi:MAG: preprotein translocase subunit Sec61beta [Candidatus Nezhaarchaeota archaeon]|nr:preprotein translocase subunit Sec61beta [Candidatus Nezhaarchaeota archaeon]MCX8141955.1 preprotein translocase subunit Sec61beta [Candidatus Nezhaarchaeota archaeon]MDW8050264.1 preprotein translocase subunit Sec61beta [Nitrososphaerota archaeon]